MLLFVQVLQLLTHFSHLLTSFTTNPVTELYSVRSKYPSLHLHVATSIRILKSVSSLQEMQVSESTKQSPHRELHYRHSAAPVS